MKQISRTFNRFFDLHGIACLLLILAMSFRAQSQNTYYVSSSQGNDDNQGTISQPFQTLDKVSSISLGPGDRVLFKKNDRFQGHFVVNGSGSETQPIVIASYGEGSKPVITGQVGEERGGDYQEAIFVYNHDHLVFENLTIENERLSYRENTDEAISYGIYVLNDKAGTRKNYTFRNLTVRNVYSLMTVDPADQQAFNGFNPAGIKLRTTWNSAQKIGNIQGVLVENCVFANLQRLGVHIDGGMYAPGVGTDITNRTVDVIIRNNEFQHLGGTCVLPTLTYNCLVENNVFYYPGSTIDPRMVGRGSSVWTWHCMNTVIQRNKCLHIRGILDSHGIHIDHKNENTFVQYNYMEDCEGGFVEILGGNNNAVYRYNISVNDGWRNNPNWKNSNHTLWINNKAGDSVDYCKNSYICNNTIYIDANFTTAIDIEAESTYVFNNLFYAVNGNMGGQQVRLQDNGTLMFISNNLFHGNINPAFSGKDTNKQTGDPGLYDQGSGSAAGYQLKPGSPAVDAGLILEVPELPGAGEGIFESVPASPAEDFYGNTLATEKLNIGSCNAKNGEIVPDEKINVTGIVAYLSNCNFYSHEPRQLNAGVIPADATRKNIIWTSLDPSVAAVNDGLVTPLQNGSAKIVVASEEGEFTDTVSVRVNTKSSFQPFLKNQIRKIYPNPAYQDYLTIHFSTTIPEARIELYNAFGQLRKSYVFSDQTQVNVNVSGLDAGIYYLRLSGNHMHETHEVVIQ